MQTDELISQLHENGHICVILRDVSSPYMNLAHHVIAFPLLWESKIMTAAKSQRRRSQI